MQHWSSVSRKAWMPVPLLTPQMVQTAPAASVWTCWHSFKTRKNTRNLWCLNWVVKTFKTIGFVFFFSFFVKWNRISPDTWCSFLRWGSHLLLRGEHMGSEWPFPDWVIGTAHLNLNQKPGWVGNLKFRLKRLSHAVIYKHNYRRQVRNVNINAAFLT